MGLRNESSPPTGNIAQFSWASPSVHYAERAQFSVAMLVFVLWREKISERLATKLAASAAPRNEVYFVQREFERITVQNLLTTKLSFME